MKLEIENVEKLVYLLQDWAQWMRHVPGIGYPSRVPIISTGMGSSSFDELLEQVDGQAMRAIDGSIDGLPPAQKAAIMRAYGLCAVFRFPRENYEAALADAHDNLAVSLTRKGVLT